MSYQILKGLKLIPFKVHSLFYDNLPIKSAAIQMKAIPTFI
jgi:hypothetical protein